MSSPCEAVSKSLPKTVNYAVAVKKLTLSPPILLRLYTLPYWSNTPFSIFDIRALWCSILNIENGGLHQYGAGPFEQQQFGKAGVEGVKHWLCLSADHWLTYSVAIRMAVCVCAYDGLCIICNMKVHKSVDIV